MTGQIGVVGGVFAALSAAHHVGDFWVQTDHQARAKGLPGWAGRRACAAHVAGYTLTCLVALTGLFAVTSWWPRPGAWAAGLAVSAVTHYVVDRRVPLVWLARLLGMNDFLRLGRPRLGRDDNPCLGTGVYALDQSWHVGWLLVSALLIAI